MIFYANSLNQIKPDIIMSGFALRPCHARIRMGGGGGAGVLEDPLLKYHKNIVSLSNWSGPLKNQKATFL